MLISEEEMSRDWYSIFQADTEPYEWLSPFKGHVQRLAVFGCWSCEPFALMKILAPTEMRVVELEEKHLHGPLSPIECYETLRSRTNDLEGRDIEFIVADMTRTVEALTSNRFDLAFCRRVLAGVHYTAWEQKRPDDLKSAVSEMVRIIRPGGWLVADEDQQFYAEYERVPLGWPEGATMPVGRDQPLDISHIFEGAGLVRASISDAPEYCLCYQKPQQ